MYGLMWAVLSSDQTALPQVSSSQRNPTHLIPPNQRPLVVWGARGAGWRWVEFELGPSAGGGGLPYRSTGGLSVTNLDSRGSNYF